MNYALVINKKLDRLIELHKDKETVYTTNQIRQLIDDLFADGRAGCKRDAPLEYRSEPGSHSAG